MNAAMMEERAMPAEAGEGPMAEALEGAPRLEQCVPVAAVSVPDEGEQMAAPEPGDTVRYEVEGKVSRVAGGHVYVDPVSINGQPVENAAGPAEEMAGLEAQAADVGYLG